MASTTKELTKFRLFKYLGKTQQLFEPKPLQVDRSKQSLLMKMRNLFLLKVKFALSGLMATSTDYVIYLLLVHKLFNPAPSNVISYTIAMIINFSLQRKYVFSLKGSISNTFVMSVIVSIGGLLMSTTIILLLTQITYCWERQYLTKLIATGLIFFYNFYMKRYIFETWN